YPGLRLPGAVVTVGALAQEDASRAGKRFFPVTIKLTQLDNRLRTGMSARVDIEVTSIPHAIVVPLQAVVEQDGVARCAVLEPTGVNIRVVEVTGRNELVAAIGNGIAAGETVLFLDPSSPRWS